MPISYASNSFSLQTQTDLSQTTTELSKVFQRLSSGLRINDASDDPADLALAAGLDSTARLATVALRNANDGVSITSVTDSAMQEIGNVLQRMSELAEQGANGVYGITQISALSTEFVALGSEIDRIAKTTSFNNILLLSNSANIAIQVGFTSAATSQIVIQNTLGTLESLGLANPGSSALSYSVLSTSTMDSQSAALNALNAVTAAIGSLSERRGTLGASESRLNVAIQYLQTAQENFEAAESNVEDEDVAQDVASMTRLQVLQQAQAAVLAQANQQPDLVLRLLS